ncbi:aspartic proteinase-like protein 2 [Olea europaea var. sylvestris]|uniref:aspartic proteinase-like protein 2 n=1 Tax=Olea europaea var. sylvestris TaxID=158386 RepID=UPI000C1CDB77|nr:aspartic proteinase-like protein 2 [Olea europaea var. sylvestris]
MIVIRHVDCYDIGYISETQEESPNSTMLFSVWITVGCWTMGQPWVTDRGCWNPRKAKEISDLGKSNSQHRHGRILQQRPSRVIDFPVEGTDDPFLVGQIQLEFFDPSTSSTTSLISCSDQMCALGEESSVSSCLNQNQCGYKFQYGDRSGASGYYVSDLIYFDTIVGDSSTSNSSALVVFGCSTSQTGDLTKSERAVDGIFGLGQQGLSVVSQLFSQGVAPNAFSHCLNGDNGGGGILVLGQIVEPNRVYTPLVPSQYVFNLFDNFRDWH